MRDKNADPIDREPKEPKPPVVNTPPKVLGTAGGDVLTGSDKAEFFYGYDGNDFIYGNGGNDTIYGGNDQDYLYGGDGSDLIYGESGNDYLQGGTGKNTLVGGSGNDSYVVESSEDVIIENPNEGYGDSVSVYRSGLVNGVYVLPNNVENLYLNEGLVGGGNASDNYIQGNSDDNYLYGDAGNDTIYGLGGQDYINGGLGNDDLYGGLGNDTLTGGVLGIDRLYGGDGDDFLTEYNTQRGAITVLVGGSGADIFNVGEANWYYVSSVIPPANTYDDTVYPGYALIADFDSAGGDKVRLKGNLNDYVVQRGSVVNSEFSRPGDGIYYKGDLVAAVSANAGFDLARDTQFYS